MRVRLTQIVNLDLNLFEFDYDLTWFVFFLNADETIYGRYGGRDASSAESRISLKGLRFAMDKALETHASPPPAMPRESKPLTARQFAASKKHKGCIHCHNVKEFDRADRQSQGRWKREDVWVYPLPENVGITLDLDVGNRIKRVAARSVAEELGLRAGDHVTRIGTTRIASFGDAIYALHKSPASGRIPIAWERSGKELSGELNVKDGWRKTNLTWRPSLLDILPSVPFSCEELTAEERRAAGLDDRRAAFRQDKFVHSSLKAVGVQKDDIVIGFDGQRIEGGMKDLLGYVRQNYLVGDVVTIDILRAGKPVSAKLKLK